MDDAADDDSRVGTVLDGRYRIHERIAAGGMGVVYRAERVKLGRAVAIKFLHPWIAGEPTVLARFELEARAMAKLDHPNCASVIDFGIASGAPYVVMDYVSGHTLRELLDAGPLAPARTSEIMRGVLSGLAHAHACGIVHRDIKPANVMVSAATALGDQVRILDFGLARLREGSQLLTSGMAVGTPSYMAPEQTVGETADVRTDVYGCGILLYEMLTGVKPFQSDEPHEVMRLHREAPRPRLGDLAPGLDALEPIVATALSIDPAQRYQSAEAFADALAEVGRHATPPPSLGVAPTALALPATDATAHSAQMAAPRHRWLIGALLGVVGGAVLLALALANDEPVPAPAAVFDNDYIDKSREPERDGIAEAKARIADGRIDAAIDLLESLRKVHPGDARAPYLLGRLYFDKLWWRDGLQAYRAALRADPTLASDLALQKDLLRGFLITPRYFAPIASFMRDEIGAPMVPLLEETARSHPNPKTRARAAGELARYRQR